jgi:hypothetical protein
MTKIKNLYLNVISKQIIPNNEQIDNAVKEYLNKLKEEDKLKIEELSLAEHDEYMDTLRGDFIKKLSQTSFQMRKLSKVAPAIEVFVKSNLGLIKELGASLLVKETDFIKLCETANINPNIEFLEIMLDTDIVYCRLLPISKDKAALALSQNKITVERYDELIEMLDK